MRPEIDSENRRSLFSLGKNIIECMRLNLRVRSGSSRELYLSEVIQVSDDIDTLSMISEAEARRK